MWTRYEKVNGKSTAVASEVDVVGFVHSGYLKAVIVQGNKFNCVCTGDLEIIDRRKRKWMSKK
jgi:hypothetical protein